MAITRSETLFGSTFKLHLDLIFEILIRLPVKPLLRFKSVCKTWYQLIENPDFMNKQHTLSKLKKNPSSLLIITLDDKSRAYNIWLRSTVKAHNPNPNPNPTPKVILYDDYTWVVAIRDGLVWVASKNAKSIICNPTIGHVHKIPPFSLAKTSRTITFYGIGFEDNECKLFTIVHSKSPSKFPVRAEMYSMSTDLWRLIDVKIGEIDACLDGYCDMKAVVINDVFYWGAYDNHHWYMVVSFHINTYICGVLKGPESLWSTSGKLLDLKGELAWLNLLDTSSFNLWMLNQKERSWTMKLRVEGLRVEILPRFCYYELECLGCESNGNLVMQQNISNSESKLFTYNLESHSIMYIPLGHYTERRILHLVVCLYTESLLSVGQKKREVK